MRRGFLASYWRRPEQYLDPSARQAISCFAQVPSDVVDAAISRLSADLASGAWARRYAELSERDEMDFGYRLVVAGNLAGPNDPDRGDDRVSVDS